MLNQRQNQEISFLSPNINYVNALSLLFLRSVDKLKIVLFERTLYEELNFYFNSIPRYIKNKDNKVINQFILQESRFGSFKQQNNIRKT